MAEDRVHSLSGQRGLLLLTDIFFPHRTQPLGISVDGDCVGNGVAAGRVSGQVAANRGKAAGDGGCWECWGLGPG